MGSKIKLISNPRYQKSGTKSYVHLMRKYRFSPTKGGRYFYGGHLQQTGRQYTNKPIGGKARIQRVLRKKVADTNEVGEVGADDVQNDSMHLAPVNIGTPAQTVNLEIDTGSADLWVWSSELPSETVSQHTGTVFDASKSSSFKKSDSTWKISYGDEASASGTVGTDLVSLGDFKVENQRIQLADTISTQFQGTGDGVLGLAFNNINTDRSLVKNLIAQDISKSANLFTVKLGHWKDTEPFYTFGFIDQETVKASGDDIHYTPIDQTHGSWLFDSSSATVNGNMITRSGNKAVADTGTPLALVDDDTCKAIYDAIPGAHYDEDSQGYIYPSDTTEDKLPVVSLAVGEKQVVVQKEDLGFAEAKSGYIYGGIQSRGTLQNDVLGSTLLNGIYAIFDVGNSQFGAVQPKGVRQSLTISQ
ncbi:hypothetical protein ASPVEDRAFT_119179 [Aspergillus versicolor CBS 583.65]|uniref:Peptidase A1 domain-containing protein n=1 Tax=Aspergillus versicolor CBS 583.65 TaxID=1036611 RepID=A0A1L9P2N2_ASPVE|nr:uncharacterized protein ASPVEDRAFT_119179 [Aspergillus versicolor CBS 583.65]OJI95785.1 hypothetical protein ASPVEDRAFT_119179 [Aspergillus versicolor CBS 583.65]